MNIGTRENFVATGEFTTFTTNSRQTYALVDGDEWFTPDGRMVDLVNIIGATGEIRWNVETWEDNVGDDLEALVHFGLMEEDEYTSTAAIAQSKKSIADDMDALIMSGTMPMFEFSLSNGEFLIVNITQVDAGVQFSFDSAGLPVYFDGDIVTINECYYVLPYDQHFDRLDNYLETIYENIVDGYLSPNGLFA